jgi:hypothetical protein
MNNPNKNKSVLTALMFAMLAGGYQATPRRRASREPDSHAVRQLQEKQLKREKRLRKIAKRSRKANRK